MRLHRNRPGWKPPWPSNRDTASAFSRSFGHVVTELTDPELQSGGVAAADVDGDGDVDFYVVGGNTEPNHFYRNRGDGTFEEAGAELGLDLVHWGSGPAFGDIDGDGDPDLFVGAVVGDRHHVFENRLDEADGRFVDVTARSGIHLTARNTMSGTFFDYDRDGFVDLFLTHWGNRYEAGEDTETVWRNSGDGSFSNTSVESGIAATLVDRDTDWSFTSNFSDIDGDGDSDLLLASDHTESQVFLNNDNGTFTNVTDRDVIIDQAGMGAAVGDYDNDGDMDWFVTSIYNLDLLDGDYIGNRFYRNEGGGVFSDMTGSAGVADGGWGWGACAADFDNDGNVDILHVNGWVPLDGKDYRDDPLRFFHNTGPGNVAFQEIAREIGFGNDEQGPRRRLLRHGARRRRRRADLQQRKRQRRAVSQRDDEPAPLSQRPARGGRRKPSGDRRADRHHHRGRIPDPRSGRSQQLRLP